MYLLFMIGFTCLWLDLNPGLTKYDTDALTIRPTQWWKNISPTTVQMYLVNIKRFAGTHNTAYRFTNVCEHVLLLASSENGLKTSQLICLIRKILTKHSLQIAAAAITGKLAAVHVCLMSKLPLFGRHKGAITGPINVVKRTKCNVQLLTISYKCDKKYAIQLTMLDEYSILLLAKSPWSQ